MLPKPRVLFTTPVLKHPPAGGPYLRIENSIKALSQISDLYIYSRVSLDDIGGLEGLSFYQAYCKAFYFPPSSIQNNIRRFSRRAINFISRKIIKRNIYTLFEESITFQYLLEIADALKVDVIWLGYGNISYPLLKFLKSSSNYKVVLDTDSVWSRFVSRGLPYAKNEEERQSITRSAQEKEEEEIWGTQLADVTTAVSLIDAEYYRGLAKDPQQIHLFSNVIDVETYQAAPPPINNFLKPCIYLAGSFGPGSPMDDAARWVINEVLPLVRQRIPNVHFYIVGHGSDTTLSDLKDPSVTITGQLLSVLEYLCHANVAIVPLRFESGTRFKILEAGACGIPVVSTSLGAEGIPITNGKDILIADEAELFAASIVRLITDSDFAQEIAENLKNLVFAKFSVASLVREGGYILDYLVAGQPKRNLRARLRGIPHKFGV
jgi:polysaccharide biosynthesis protein PslH